MKYENSVKELIKRLESFPPDAKVFIPFTEAICVIEALLMDKFGNVVISLGNYKD